MNNLNNPPIPFATPVNYAIPAGRTVDTVYQNNSGKAMLVSITAEIDHNELMYLKIENVSPPTVIHDELRLITAATHYIHGGLHGVVPPGWYYTADRGGTGSALVTWVEST